MSLLDELVTAAVERAERLDLDSLPVEVGSRPGFAESLRGRERLSLIAELKRTSPSHGEFASGMPLTERAATYAANGAAAISVLTEPSRFRGSIDDLTQVARACELPLLMKDFIVSERQVEAARRSGASAVLLIVRILEPERLAGLLRACEEHALDALVECHEESEVESALEAGARIVGVNNRDLDTLEIDLARGERLLELVPEDILAVAESGYASARDLDPIRGRADAVLVGGALMNARDLPALVRELSR